MQCAALTSQAPDFTKQKTLSKNSSHAICGLTSLAFVLRSKRLWANIVPLQSAVLVSHPEAKHNDYTEQRA